MSIDNISTKRLFIRKVRASDSKYIQAVMEDAASSEYARYDRPFDLDDASVYRTVSKWAAESESGGNMFFSVCLDDAVIGYIVFRKNETGYEAGFCFHSDHQGRGYAKESVSAVLAELKKEGVQKITAGTALDNIPSVRLLLSLGFVQTSTERVSFYKDENGADIYFDGAIYELSL